MFRSVTNSDLVFTNFRHVITSIPGITLSKILNKPIILDYFDIDQKIPEIIYKFNAKNADAIFALTHLLYNKANLYGCANVIYVPNFVDTKLFTLDKDIRSSMRKMLGINEDEIVIGYAGGFWYVEGVPLLLKAFRNLIKKYNNIKLAIIGDIRWPNIDDDIPKLIEEMDISQYVILIHFQPHNEVPKYLSAFDILCCPKIDCEINELITPIKVIEYLSMGLPTIASAVGEIPSVISDHFDGFLVPPGDINSLEGMLEWIINNPSQSKIIGLNGRETVLKNYSYSSIEKTIYESIYKVLTANKIKSRKGDVID